MVSVTTDPDPNHNERFRRPLRADYMAMKCLGLPRTAVEADFLLSEPNSKTYRWPGVMLKNDCTEETECQSSQRAKTRSFISLG